MTNKENVKTHSVANINRVCAHSDQQLAGTSVLDSLTMWWGQQPRPTRWRSRSWASCSPPLHLCGSSTNSSGRWPSTGGWGRGLQPPHSPGIWETVGREGGRGGRWQNQTGTRAVFRYQLGTAILTMNVEPFMTHINFTLHYFLWIFLFSFFHKLKSTIM